MAERLLDHEPLVRVIAFSVVLILVSMGEFLRPRRAPTSGSRWRNNIILSAIDAAIVRVILPFGLTGFAVWLQTRGIGVLPAVTDSTLARFLVSCATLDLVVYLQHRLFHAVPALWRFHQVHHSDPDVDATTGVRFHPVEILLSLVLKAAVIAALGAPPLAVLCIRDRAERGVAAQSREPGTSGSRGYAPPNTAGYSGHAPDPSFQAFRRTNRQLRFQFVLVGPSVQYVPWTATYRSPRNATGYRRPGAAKLTIAITDIAVAKRQCSRSGQRRMACFGRQSF